MSKWFTPVVNELPFFVLFLFAISITTLRRFLSDMILGRFGEGFLTFSGNFPRAVFVAYLFTLLVYYSRSRVVRVGSYVLASVLFVVCVFLMRVFSMTLQPDVIILLAETNAKESSEFLSTYLFTPGGITALVGLVIYVAAVVFLERRRAQLVHLWGGVKWHKAMNTVLCVLLCVGLVQFKSYAGALTVKKADRLNDLAGNGRPDAYDSLTALYMCAFSIHHVSKQMKQALSAALMSHVEPQNFEGDSLNVIYVIGESYNKYHSHLYGYRLPTTPNLDGEQQRGNLFVFDNVVTPFNLTTLVMKNTFSCNSMRNGEEWSDKPFFPTLFKKAGYNVFHWDNEKGDEVPARLGFALEAFIYNKEIIKASYTKVNNRTFPYDGRLVDDFSRNVKQGNVRQLVMFHLYGQHGPYDTRYPHEEPFNRFSAGDITLKAPYLNDAKRQIIAEYDNATLYNDYVLKQIIDLYRDDNTVLLYFSDHGEEAYDYRDFFGRVEFDPETQPEGLRYQYDIPFMIWCSDKYMERNPEVVNNIRRSLHKPFRIDEISQVLFHLADLKTEYYRPECDLLSPQYEKYPRVVWTRTMKAMKYDK